MCAFAWPLGFGTDLALAIWADLEPGRQGLPARGESCKRTENKTHRNDVTEQGPRCRSLKRGDSEKDKELVREVAKPEEMEMDSQASDLSPGAQGWGQLRAEACGGDWRHSEGGEVGYMRGFVQVFP